MLLLLSAAKKKFGTFITPAGSGSTTVSFWAANAFTYGPITYSVSPSGKLDGGAFVAFESDAVKISSYGANAFTYEVIPQASAIVSSVDASFFNPTKNPTKAFKLDIPTFGGFVYAPSTVTRAFKVTPVATLGFGPNSGTSLETAFYVKNDITYNMLLSPVPEIDGPAIQTITFTSETV